MDGEHGPRLVLTTTPRDTVFKVIPLSSKEVRASRSECPGGRLQHPSIPARVNGRKGSPSSSVL